MLRAASALGSRDFGIAPVSETVFSGIEASVASKDVVGSVMNSLVVRGF
jgi:hypothetical protein